MNTSDETLLQIHLTVWIKIQSFEAHPCNPRFLTQFLFLLATLLTESSACICKMNLKEKIWALQKIFKISLNIRLHQIMIPIPDTACILDKTINFVWKDKKCLFTNSKKIKWGSWTRRQNVCITQKLKRFPDRCTYNEVMLKYTCKWTSADQEPNGIFSFIQYLQFFI